MDEDVLKKIDELNVDKEITNKNKIENEIKIDTFIEEKIRPILKEYFKKLEEMGARVELEEDFVYKIYYNDGEFTILRNCYLPQPEFDFMFEYSFVGAGIGNSSNFMMIDYKKTLNDFILKFHKYLLANS